MSELEQVEESLGRPLIRITLGIADDSDDQELSETNGKLTEQLADSGPSIELFDRLGPSTGLSRAVLGGFRFIHETALESWVTNLDDGSEHDARATLDLL